WGIRVTSMTVSMPLRAPRSSSRIRSVPPATTRACSRFSARTRMTSSMDVALIYSCHILISVGAWCAPCPYKKLSTSCYNFGAAFERFHCEAGDTGDIADGGRKGRLIAQAGFHVIERTLDLIAQIKESGIELIDGFELLLVDLDRIEQPGITA